MLVVVAAAAAAGTVMGRAIDDGVSSIDSVGGKKSNNNINDGRSIDSTKNTGLTSAHRGRNSVMS